jgi:quinol monooxygenase YgiN
MITLNPDDHYYTLINTFTVEPERAEELLKALSDATVRQMSKRQGFISANLHMSKDRKRVTNYVQWRTKEDNDAMLSDPATQEHLKVASGIATSFDPIYYELRESHEAPAE